jgi:phage major head subunit gpT-like protein
MLFRNIILFGADVLSSRAIIGEFYARLNQNPGSSWIDKISMLFQSNQPSETYKWLGQVPMMRQWVGGREPQGLRDAGVTIPNLEFEATLEFLMRDMKRDKSDQTLTRVRELADRTNAHWAKLLSTLMIAAESAVCYDGQYFFDTDHSEGDSGTQSNALSITISGLPCNQHGSTTAPSPEEMELSILKTIQAILGFKDDQGEPMNEGASEFMVMVPVPFFAAAAAAITNPVLTAGKTNTLVSLNEFSIGLAVNPRLTWTTKFATFRADGNVKAFIRQEEEGVVFKALAEDSEYAFQNNRYLYGVNASRNVGYGFWQHACLGTLA